MNLCKSPQSAIWRFCCVIVPSVECQHGKHKGTMMNSILMIDTFATT